MYMLECPTTLYIYPKSSPRKSLKHLSSSWSWRYLYAMMESERGIRLRNHTLRPIETKRENIGIDVEEEPLSPSALLFHEPNFNVHIIAIMGSINKICPEVFKANLGHTLLKHPRFSSLLVVDEKNGGKMKWVKTKVDLDKHVIVPNVDYNMESADKFVEDYIYNLTKTSINNDKSKPLWDLHLLNVKTSKAEALGIFRVHHSLGDGTSLMSLLLACTRQVSNPEALPTIPINKKKYKDGKFKGFWKCFYGLWWILKLFWNTVIDVLMFLVTCLFLKDTETPLKGHEEAVYNPRRIVFQTVSLDDMKLVKNALNMTVNDVALGITQAGLSKYLDRRSGEHKNSKERGNKSKVPKKIRLRSTMLINIRPSTGIQDLADMMAKNTQAKWGNWIGYVLLPFTIALRDDPLDYIREAKATIDRKKHSLEAIYTFSIAELALKLFGIRRASTMTHRIMSHTTLSFSNLVGPLEKIGFYGHEMAYLAPTSYGQPHALMINFQSYVNKMSIVLSVDEDTIPDPHQLCDDIVQSLNLMKGAVIERGLVN